MPNGNARDAVLDYLDGLHHAVGLTTLLENLPDLTIDDLKEATRSLYEDRCINRVSVKSKGGQQFYVFYSLYVRTVNVYREAARPDPDPVPLLPAAASLEPVPQLTPEGAVALLESAGWKAEPEEVTERRVADRRRFGIMDVIDRWRLCFRLSRIIEIVGSARNRKLTQADADAIVRLIREHVREQA